MIFVDRKKILKYCQARFPPFSPDVADPCPDGEQPVNEQAEWSGGMFEQLHNDAGLSTFRLPVCRL